MTLAASHFLYSPRLPLPPSRPGPSLAASDPPPTTHTRAEVLAHEQSRLQSTLRLREAWADIQLRHESYSSDTLQRPTGKTRALREEDDDIIDLNSMTIVLDRGVLRNAQQGSFAIGSYALPGGDARWYDPDRGAEDDEDDDWEEGIEEDDDPMGQWDQVLDAPSVLSRVEKRKRGIELEDLRMFLLDEVRLQEASHAALVASTTLNSPAEKAVESTVSRALNSLPNGTGNVILSTALQGSGASSRRGTPVLSSRFRGDVVEEAEEEEEDDDELALVPRHSPQIISSPSDSRWKGKGKEILPSLSGTTNSIQRNLHQINLSSSSPVVSPVARSSIRAASASPLIFKQSRASTSASTSTKPLKASPLRHTILPPGPTTSSPVSSAPAKPLRRSPRHLESAVQKSPRARESRVTRSGSRANVSKDAVPPKQSSSASAKGKEKGKQREREEILVISDSEEERDPIAISSPSVMSARPSSPKRSSLLIASTTVASRTIKQLPTRSTSVPVRSSYSIPRSRFTHISSPLASSSSSTIPIPIPASTVAVTIPKKRIFIDISDSSDDDEELASVPAPPLVRPVKVHATTSSPSSGALIVNGLSTPPVSHSMSKTNLTSVAEEQEEEEEEEEAIMPIPRHPPSQHRRSTLLLSSSPSVHASSPRPRPRPLPPSSRLHSVTRGTSSTTNRTDRPTPPKRLRPLPLALLLASSSSPSSPPAPLTRSSGSRSQSEIPPPHQRRSVSVSRYARVGSSAASNIGLLTPMRTMILAHVPSSTSSRGENEEEEEEEDDPMILTPKRQLVPVRFHLGTSLSSGGSGIDRRREGMMGQGQRRGMSLQPVMKSSWGQE